MEQKNDLGRRHLILKWLWQTIFYTVIVVLLCEGFYKLLELLRMPWTFHGWIRILIDVVAAILYIVYAFMKLNVELAEYDYEKKEKAYQRQKELKEQQPTASKCERPLPPELDSNKTREYLDRLVTSGDCNEDYSCKDITKKTRMSQFAHVISGLLQISDKHKWAPFQKLWRMDGLAQAFYNRNGRAIDKEILDIFPEYRRILPTR